MNLFTYTYYSYYYFYFGKKVEWEFVCMKITDNKILKLKKIRWIPLLKWMYGIFL
mgnify:CR=1 FL=1